MWADFIRHGRDSSHAIDAAGTDSNKQVIIEVTAEQVAALAIATTSVTR